MLVPVDKNGSHGNKSNLTIRAQLLYMFCSVSSAFYLRYKLENKFIDQIMMYCSLFAQ